MMNKRWIGLLVFCVTNFCFTEAQQECTSYAQTPCDDGECIDSDLFCDGMRHCKDGSDETGQRCLAEECPQFSWRCAYGACARRDAKCNQVQDCVDNSDENALLCNYTTLNKFTKDGKFKCNSGELISADFTCDGPKNCVDGSDETTEQCSVINCPEWGFRCAYGGCISNHLKCNGAKNCADGSDEYPLVCNKPYERVNLKNRLTRAIQLENRCKVSENPNLHTTLLSENKTLRLGSYVGEFQNVVYACRQKHVLEGSTDNYCENGVWLYPEPNCTKLCRNDHLNGVVFTAHCEYEDRSIPCSSPLKIGTIAKISCPLGYRKPRDRVVQDILQCDEFGEWDYSPFRCEPICGTEKNDGVPFAVGGDVVNITSVPWHAAIYVFRSNRYENICGGTIINAKVVISAAHCFWIQGSEQVVDHTLITVGVGKVYRDFFAQEPYRARFHNVAELYVAKGYQDNLMAYRDDIAILVLVNYIIFTPEVKPICLEWHEYHGKYVRSGIVGRIAGWGLTGPNLVGSNELRMIELPSVSYDECRDSVDPKYRTSLAGDKFCVRSQNGETVCQGDSGGGFVVPKKIDGENVYFLVGIVSNSLKNVDECVGDFYTTFTNIQFHQRMILEYEAHYRPMYRENGALKNHRHLEFCDNEVIRGVTFQALCEYNGARIPCQGSPLPPGTRANISCQVGYQKPDKIVQETIVCDNRGEWDYYPFKCEQVCGVEPAMSTPFVLGGSRLNNTFVPWHVGIYSQGTGKYEQICGGTIINAKVVISAAHCFWNVREDRLHDKSLFAVYAGKYYRNYYQTREPLPTQVLQVEDIVVPPGYKDVNLAYVSDIAIVVLTEFIEFRSHIKPVCIEWQSYSNKAIRSNFRGRVAGWGKGDDNQPSEELKAIDLPTVSYEQCIEEVEPRYKTLVTGDKFCVQRLPGEAVCEGDSGGGFAIPKPINGQNVFYLWGIVSNGLTYRRECTGEYFTVFTNIQFYQDMITYYEVKNRAN